MLSAVVIHYMIKEDGEDPAIENIKFMFICTGSGFTACFEVWKIYNPLVYFAVFLLHVSENLQRRTVILFSGVKFKILK